MKELFAVILAGGSGTRLWPLSRSLAPKQLLRLTGDLTLLQDTIRRLQPLVAPERMIFVTSAELVHEVRRQAFAHLGEESVRCRFVAEPLGRNTAPAVILGAHLALAQDPEALVLAVPSDQVVTDRNGFVEAVKKCLPAAREGRVVTFGIVPERPETGYGYIKAGKRAGSVFNVAQFEEKPPREKAEQFVSEGGYYWNSGMFLFAASTMLEEARRHLPALEEELGRVDLRTLATLPDAYQRVEAVSLDYGIMEKTEKAAVLPVSLGWSDVGSWDSLFLIADKDPQGNVVTGNVIPVDSSGCLLMGSKHMVAAVGVTDLIVVDTEDALLVCPRGRSQDVRKVVDRLKGEGRRDLLEGHVTVQRPWGSFVVLEEGPTFKIKKITVDSGHALSLQTHRHRSEHWVVIRGTAEVTKGEETFTVRLNESTFIPKGERHRLANRTDEPLEIIEVQNGELVSEDDIVRIDDPYGRPASGETLP